MNQMVIFVGQLIGRLPFASLCDFTRGPGLEELFLGSFKFAIDPMIYQEEREKRTGSLVYEKVVYLQGREDGYVSHTLCGFPEVGLIFAEFKRWNRRPNRSRRP